MKKIYLLLSAALITTAGFAQYRSITGPVTVSTKNLNVTVSKTTNEKAAGDSLLYFNSEGFFVADAQDNTDFALTNEDFDGGTPQQTGWPTTFVFSFIDTDANKTPYTTPGGNFFPGDITSGTDTAWFIGASSWFTTAGTANNWFNFGPITIPAGTNGNKFKFHDHHNASYTDSYDVYIVPMSSLADATTPSGPTDVLANSLTPAFSKAQISGAANGPDTSWTLHTIDIDAFVGQRVFVFFNHTATDGDVLFLDEMWVQEGNPVGIEELNNVNFNVFPNPSTGEFNINLTANKAGDVNLTVKNVVGQTVIDKVITVSSQKRETISLANYSKGIYFLTIDNKTVKLIVE